VIRSGAARRRPIELHKENQDQHDAQPVDGRALTDQRERPSDDVGGGISLLGAHDARRNGNGDGVERRRQRELDGRRQPFECGQSFRESVAVTNLNAPGSSLAGEPGLESRVAYGSPRRTYASRPPVAGWRTSID
jgi:hypothetical protein